jgi:hypothetical protein
LSGTGEFLTQAKEPGIDLSLEDLRKLHEVGLLMPLYRVDDDEVGELRIDTEAASGMNVRGDEFTAGEMIFEPPVSQITGGSNRWTLWGSNRWTIVGRIRTAFPQLRGQS